MTIIKGCQRKIIFIKNTGTQVFEAAYFILSDKAASTLCESDMIKEANRIIAENITGTGVGVSAVRPKVSALKYFVSGVLTSAVLCGLLLFILIR